MKTIIFCYNKQLTFKNLDSSAQIPSGSVLLDANDDGQVIYFSSHSEESSAVALKDFTPGPLHATGMLKALGHLYWPFSTSALDLKSKGIDLLLGPEDFKHDEELICFGGSFSPWHEGHGRALAAAKLLHPSANIMVIPDHNPQKKITKTNLEIWEQWKTLAVMLSPRSVYPGFLATMSANPTSSWFPQLPIKMKGLLIGGDSFLALKTWIKSSDILQSAGLIMVLPRGESDADFAQASMQFKKEFPHLQIERLPHHPFEKLSSTQIRKQQ